MIRIITNNPDVFTTKLLTSACEQLGLEHQLHEPSQLDVEEFLTTDIVINRYAAYDYLDCDLDKLNQIASIQVNKPEDLRIFRDKWLQWKYLKHLNILLPRTESMAGSLLLDNDEYVLKTRRGMGGHGVSFYSSAKSLSSKIQELEESGDLRYLVQEKIEAESELRVYFMKGKPSHAVMKQSPITKRFNRNDAQKWEMFSIEQLSGSIAQVISMIPLGLGAADFLITPDKEILLEVNTCPGIKFLSEQNINYWQQVLREFVR